MDYDYSSYNDLNSDPDFSLCWNIEQTYPSTKGEFCFSRDLKVAYGYTIEGFSTDIVNHKARIPQSDFQTFVKEISDSGTSTFNRMLTDEERTYLLLKFGYPLLKKEDLTKFFNKVKLHISDHPYE